MNLRTTFQSIIALHQEEFPYALIPRDLSLPVDSGKIITVTGIRRCGKSSLLKLAVNRLLSSGISREKILYIGFDDERFSGMSASDFDEILNAYREMYPDRPLSEVYMFFDEIQLIKGWDLFVIRVFKNYCQNVFITGSTAEMLSGEMASALRGYPDEYCEHVLSFSEYLRFRSIEKNRFTEDGAAIIRQAFRNYCREGGYPEVVLEKEKSKKIKLLQSYFDTMLFRDMIEHFEIKTPAPVVRYFIKRIMENLTKPTSINNIYNELKSMGQKVGKDYLYDWLDYACQIFLFDRVPKYTKSLVKETSSPAKYYMSDSGLRNAVLLQQAADDGKSLENIVFRMLKATLGEDDKIFFHHEVQECDFVIQRAGEITELVQVCWSLDESNEKRELSGLAEASRLTGCRNCRVITFDRTDEVEYDNLRISIEAAWKLNHF